MEPTTPAISGPMWPVPLARYDHDSSVWRTSRPTFLSDLLPSWETLPQWGSMRSGALYGRPRSARPTGESASSSPHGLLPTPSANPFDQEPEVFEPRHARLKETHQNGNGFGLTLGMAVKLLPTPIAQESQPTEEYLEEIRASVDLGHRLYLPGRKGHTQQTLSRIAMALLPTPTAGDAKGSRNRTDVDTHKRHDGMTLTDWLWMREDLSVERE